MQEKIPSKRPGVAEVWGALFNLAVATANQNSQMVGASMRAAADLAEAAGKNAEASRLRGLAARVGIALMEGPCREYLEPISTERVLGDLIIPRSVLDEVEQFLWERSAADSLRERGLRVSSRLMFLGPPGCGKTSLASAIARELKLPLLRMATHAVIGSHMGETGSRVGKVLRQVQSEPCVLLIDEADTLFWKRSDGGSTEGEMRRVVGTLLPLIEEFSDRGVLVAASNVPATRIDAAVRRRFDLVLDLPSGLEDAAVRKLAGVVAAIAPNEVPREFVRACLENCLSLADVEASAERAVKAAMRVGRTAAEILGEAAGLACVLRR